MQKKKKILFVNESLTLAGGEKSLIALLTNLNPSLYEIDLQLFLYGGALDKWIPDYVNVLPPLAYTAYTAQPWGKNCLDAVKGRSIPFLKSKLLYSVRLRKRKLNHPEKAQLLWETSGKYFSDNPKKYDVAIAYAQGVPTFYVLDKVNATKKITWVNAKPNFPPKNKLFQIKYYEKFDTVIAVSDITHQQFIKTFPQLSGKTRILYDIVDYHAIIKMADSFSVDFQPDTFNILTVARLNLKSKRYDIALEACKILKEKGIHFHWYALGEGDYRAEMERYIRENRLEDCFTLLGTKANPYPYFKAADLYVQTSELESYGISIAEARLLNTPIVTTRFDTVFMQMIDGKNGLVTDLNAEAIADAIIRILNDKALYNSIVEYLKTEVKENTETIDKFNQLINN